jgi:hypothetical protein
MHATSSGPVKISGPHEELFRLEHSLWSGGNVFAAVHALTLPLERRTVIDAHELL